MLVQFIWSHERKTCFLLRRHFPSHCCYYTSKGTDVEKSGISRVSKTLGTIVILTSATETCSEQGKGAAVWKLLVAAPFSAAQSLVASVTDTTWWQPLQCWMAAGTSNYVLKSADSTAGSVP